MNYTTRILAFVCLLCMPLLVRAQHPTFYLPDTSIRVYAYGQQQTLPWCGGFNNPQFASGDLNNDGLPDLVVFENNNSVRTFINKGTAGHPNYRYAPEYALNFPPLYDYLIMADYDRDGIPDLFHQGAYGFAVFKGYYNAYNQLCFNFYRDLFYYNDVSAGGPANAFNNPGDIPAVVDVDGDGDLDFVSYDILGGWMNYYRNMQVEYALPKDSISINLWDECWGRVYQGFWRTHQLGETCDNSSLIRNPGTGGMEEKKTHSGNTPCLFDWDMDGDMDYLDGSISFNQMTFLKNGRVDYNATGADSMVYQDTMWQNAGVGGTEINLPIWPAAFNVDIDQDGKKDLLIAPNGIGICANYNNIWYYKNNTVPGTPDWQFQSDSFLVDQSIDLGTAAMPMLFDYNKDGKPDLFIGSDGYRQPDGSLRSKISYYLNTSNTSSGMSFTLQTSDFMGLNATNFQGIAPAAGDIDNDGKSDLVIGHTNGTLSYYKNMAASEAVAPDWQLAALVLTDMNGDTIDVGGNSAPFIYDVDKDGKPDLIIGDIYGYVQYYQNVSTTPGAISLKLINTQLGQAHADPAHGFGNYSTPFIGKVDSTGVDYLLLGSNSGNIYRYTGFQSGDTTAVYTLLDETYSFIDTVHNLYNHPGSVWGIYDGQRTAPVVGDIAGDGNYEMLVGEVKGGVELYKSMQYTEGVPTIPGNENGQVKVYPNPATDVLNISWNGVLQPTVKITVVNMEGQLLYTSSAATAAQHTAIPVATLPPGMYVCIVQSGVNRYYSKFTKQP